MISRTSQVFNIYCNGNFSINFTHRYRRTDTYRAAKSQCPDQMNTYSLIYKDEYVKQKISGPL